MSTKCCSMRTRCKCFCNLLGCTDCANWHSTAKSLCHRNDIRLDAIVHVAHYSSCSAPSCLNLVNQKEHSLFVTELAEAFHKLWCCRMYTTFALYRLNHDSDCVLCTCIFECLQVIVRSIRETVCHRSESNLTSISRLTGC